MDQPHITSGEMMEMLSLITHELRSPLDSIVTLGKTLTGGYYGRIDEKQKQIVERIVKKAEYMTTISSGLLHLALFESGKLKPSPGLVDLYEDVLVPAVEILAPQIEANRIQFEQEIRESIYPAVCDSDLIKIVLVNLLGNAVKYGKKNGLVKVSLKQTYQTYIISVWNEGRGFSRKEKGTLFKKFSRIQAPELMKKKGAGVGLYVSWQIVHLHGGELVAESETGSWAEFIVYLPMYPGKLMT